MSRATDGSSALWSFLWGKRTARRHPLALRVALRIGEAQVLGETANLSAGGVLVRTSESALLRALGARAGEGVLQAIHDGLSGGFRIRFPGRWTAVDGRLVRAELRSAETDSLYLGCSFARPLGSSELRRLNLDPLHCGSESGARAVPLARMTHRPRPEDPLQVEIREAGGGLLVMTPLRGLSGGTLGVLLPELDATEAVARLSHRELALLVRDSKATIWSSSVYLLGVLPRDAGGVEVVLVATRRPGPEVVSRLRGPAAKPVTLREYRARAAAR